MTNLAPRRPAPPARLERPPPLDIARDALFLDLDGTLLEIAPRPDMVAADTLLRGLLRELHDKLDGALAIVSGRPLAEIDTLLGDFGCALSGVHGQQRRQAGTETDASQCDVLNAAADMLRRLSAGDLFQVLVEHKPGAIAIHYRQAPEHADLVRRATAEIAAHHGLKMLDGAMVCELLPASASKANAIAAFMASPPFQGRRAIAIGDDTTDEDAFAEARRHGGFGVRVGEAKESRALYRLANPRAVRTWLIEGLTRQRV